jgi:thymidylate synthase (FAD)
MKVQLISYTKPVDNLREHVADAQALVAYCARVSNPGNQHNQDTSERLVRYLIRHQHWSPLEMVSACLEIVTTRDIARQILRHRSFSFQEFSQRYADPTKELNFVTREARLQDSHNRQNSTQLDTVNNQEHRELYNEWHRRQLNIIRQAREDYVWAVQNGIAKEQARVVLPEGLTESRLYMNGTLRSWVHYLGLRSANGTQLEHQDIARACAKVISEIFPICQDIASVDSAQ